ncbi:ABC transporter substrate-binding protein, partial [Methanosarcinales archaeon]
MKRILTASLILLASVIICFCLFTPAIGAVSGQEVRIADKTGDWGNPSPYLAYARGSGYVRAHFIFDTLVWKNETAGP